MTEYIGDGAHVVFDGVGFELRANSHDCPTDTIYLEPEVLAALNVFAERTRKTPESLFIERTRTIQEASHD